MDSIISNFAEIKELMTNREVLIGFILLITIIVTVILVHMVQKLLVNNLGILMTTEQKIQKAKEQGQVVVAQLKGENERIRHNYYRRLQYSDEEYSSYHRQAKKDQSGYVSAYYTYSLDGIHQKKKKISFKISAKSYYFPNRINIYYLGHKVYTDYDAPDILPLLLYYLIPIAACLLILFFFFPDLANA